MTTKLHLNSTLAPPWPLRKFSVEEYHQLGELGVLTSEDSVELLEGWIVEKMNQRPIHGYIVRMLNELFMRELPPGWLCQCQLPIAAQRSEPEPDIAIIRGAHGDFRNHHPTGSDCLLVIEVADTSIERDRSKALIYCEAGVQEYWIVNVTDKSVERYEFSNPVRDVTASVFTSDSQVSLAVDDTVVTLDLAKIFEGFR